MDLKYCDKCRKEILKRDKCYTISFYEREKDDTIKEIEVCSKCYREIEKKL